MTAEPSRQQEHRIVVGVDGSESSKQALVWAVRQARLTGAVVEAVIACEYLNAYGYPLPVRGVDIFELATKAVKDAITEISADTDGAAVRYRVVEGNPARVLLDASTGADLLVVGSRGHGGLGEALLGSVGQDCVHHATCPVVVIRGSAAVPGH
jgi:nucleotide-binding universal stress UspA family protein